jgi:UDP-N-acetylglucosamine 2-epimerase (non-hydrolysing)
MSWRILCVAGARPNFMKIAPLMRAFARDQRFDARLVHTGQHYDEKLSKIFFEELAIPRPDIELEVGSGSHAHQTAEIMKRFEPVLEREQPHGVLVVGDVNSTIGCAIVTAKFFRKEAFRARRVERRRPLMIHVESGLRSNDPDMPEEINRVLTDAISDLLFVSEPAGMTNLAREGVGPDRAIFVGNVMIDTLRSIPRAGCSASRSAISTSFDCRRPRAWCSPIPVACRKRPPCSAFRASRCARTPSDR